ncbi:MAG: hypothetical protein VYB39_02455 [Pseudomonadota bacterium]|nr:hypothetical protein [Pseudomonadota bacterium]
MTDDSKTTPTKTATTSSDKTEKSTASDKSDNAKSSDASANTPSKVGGGEKSARESVGGSGAVHYGFFSNIKTPEYKSGWDDIWGGPRRRASVKKMSKNGATKKQKAPRKKKAVTVSLDLADLPEDVRAGLVTAARTKLTKSRVNYDKHLKAGAVHWSITCDVEKQ